MIKTRTIIVTKKDLERLQKLLGESRRFRTEDEQSLLGLTAELERATVVASEDVPSDTVTMNSKVRISVDGKRKQVTWTIVYPDEADVESGKISVLAPLGTALLGYREGDTIEWEVPAGRRQYRIMKILHQPEAAGDWER